MRVEGSGYSTASRSTCSSGILVPGSVAYWNLISECVSLQFMASYTSMLNFTRLKMPRHNIKKNRIACKILAGVDLVVGSQIVEYWQI